MEKMTVEEVIDKLANTKIYTRGRGIEVVNKIYPILSKLEFEVKKYDVFPFFELIKEDDSSMLYLKPYYSMQSFSICEFNEITPEEILDIEFEDKKENNPDFEMIEMPFRVGDKVSFMEDNHVYEDVINNIEVKLSMYLNGNRQINYIFKTNKKTIYSKDELFHTTEELLNNLKNKSIKSC